MTRVAILSRLLADRLAVQRVLASDSGISVVGSADVGGRGVELISRTRPDVATVGVDGDGTESFHVVRRIMGHCPTPILLLMEPGQSAGELPARIMAAGALDAMEKPQCGAGHPPNGGGKELLLRVRLLARVPVITHMDGKLKSASPRPQARASGSSCRGVVAIASSTGGPMALARLFSSLPADIPAPVLVVQHIAEGFVQGLATWFQERSHLKVQVATGGILAEPGLVLMGPDHMHMMVERGGVVALEESSTSASHRPSADRLFESVADIYGSRAIGVVLTGMGSDGAQGAVSIKRAGGRVIAQDEATSAIFGMPRAVIEAGAADEVLSIDLIPEKLVEWIGML